MTTVYFVRHAEPNYNNHDDAARELTAKGLLDQKLVTTFLADKHVDAIFSSPYKRAVDTVADFAESRNLEICTVNDFRERRVDRIWIDDFAGFCKAQWADYDYKLSDGESLREVQSRNLAALSLVLNEYKDKTIVIGSHGTALCTIIHHYDPTFGYKEFNRIKGLMPWIVKMEFDRKICTGIEEFNVFA